MSTETGPSLRAGLRLCSQVCDTEVIVVRAGAGPAVLSCGGVPMRERGSAHDRAVTPAGTKMTGSMLGKRYTHPDHPGLEVLVTVAGNGGLSIGDGDLVIKESKPLPASD
ncbi:hypothetical protein K7711_09965 [Nocardia sp. CA2R105]|uniref:hypothetical protein n=1 Tax=Nocardia coffeae TaxID=2873381 RepID=UPI001CA60AF0|nr:hypothetical protein [Nocardia coffeae]MBY8856801.1 hypothetical protein [Nocardia coffeae]